MDFVTFARLNGVLIDRPIEDGRWHRVPTESHPRKRNGAYMSRGVYGFVQDHAAHTEAVLWTPDATELAKVDHEAIQRQVNAAAAKIKTDQRKAAEKAGLIMRQSELRAGHPYLEKKGFADELAPVWRTETDGMEDAMLCVPMYADSQLVGVQTISSLPAHTATRRGEEAEVPEFEKRFLFGQRTSEAVRVFNGGPTERAVKVFCEGYATALSVRRALQALRQPYSLFVTFTAGNLLKVATNHGTGIVIADFDKPSKQHPHTGGHGKAVAEETKLPFWISDREGEDFNDYEVRLGTFRAGQSLRPLLLQRRKP